MINWMLTTVELSPEPTVPTKDIESIETSHCRKTKSCCVNVYHKLADKLPCEIKPHKNFLCLIILIKAEFLLTEPPPDSADNRSLW